MKSLVSDALLHSSRLVHGNGRLLRLESSSPPRLPCLVYLPPERHVDGRTLVSVHGVSRNVEEHVELYRPYADAYGVVLVAPLFAANRFRDYQRLGRKGRGPRADLALIRLLNELGGPLGIDSGWVDMFGFSGGAQFAHRFAMAHPQRVRRLSLGAAGWYTMPDKSLSYPLGVGDAAGLEGVRLDLSAAARLPTLVLVGELDDCPRDQELNRSREIRRRQGRTRRSRAQTWTQAMNAYSKRHREPAAVSLRVLPGVDHSFRTAVFAGAMGSHVFDHAYGEWTLTLPQRPDGRVCRPDAPGADAGLTNSETGVQ